MTVIKKRSNGQWRIVSGAPLNVVAPGAPTAVAATSPTSGYLRVTWTAPSDQGNGDIVKFEVRALKVGGGPTVTVFANPSDTDTLLPGVTPGAAYTCVVLASTTGGQGPASNPSAQVTVSSAATYTLPSGLIIPAGWDNPATTGLFGDGWEYGDLTPFTGNITTTANGQLIEGLDIRGNITVRHNNVTIRHCRIRSIQTSPTLIAGEAVVDGNQSIIQGGNRVWLSDNMAVRYCEIIGSTDPNINDQTGAGCGGSTAQVTDHCLIRDLSDGITPGDNSITTHNCVYDMKVADGSHADCYQIIDGANALVQDNTFISLVPGAVPVTGGDNVQRIPKDDATGNAAIQIGAQAGPLTNLIINHNYLSGGNYTINSNNSGEATNGNITGAFTNNVFSGYNHYGPLGNYGSGMTFDASNVWEATRVTNAWAGIGETIEVYWHATIGTSVDGSDKTLNP